MQSWSVKNKVIMDWHDFAGELPFKDGKMGEFFFKCELVVDNTYLLFQILVEFTLNMFLRNL